MVSNARSLVFYLYQAWVNMCAHRLRSFLAVLGLTIGSASVVALLYCSQLATLAVVSKLSELGTQLISVSLIGQHKYNAVTLQALDNLARSEPAVESYVPIVFVYSTVYGQAKKQHASIVGASESLAHVGRAQLAAGRFISDFDQDAYCVVGASVLSGTPDEMLGQQLRLGHHYCTVIGVLKHVENNFFIPVDFDHTVYLPVSMVLKTFKESHIQDVVFALGSSDNVQLVETTLQESMTRISPKTRYFFRNPQTLIEKVTEQKQQLSRLLTVIGGIALLVGGIGIMNIMLVAVVERQREIGVRLALGANTHDIQNMFLTEAILFALLGGIFGVLIGGVFSVAVAHVSGWPMHFLIMPVLLGLSVAFVVGVFFGYYPARSAARLNPIDTLRHD